MSTPSLKPCARATSSPISLRGAPGVPRPICRGGVWRGWRSTRQESESRSAAAGRRRSTASSKRSGLRSLHSSGAEPSTSRSETSTIRPMLGHRTRTPGSRHQSHPDRPARRAPMNTADDVRRARRAFIRAHHPDRGGDTEFFVAGLERFSFHAGPKETRIRVVIRPSPDWRGRVVAVGRLVVRRRAGPPRVR